MATNRYKVRICQKCDVRFEGHRAKQGNWCPACIEKVAGMTYRDCTARKDFRCSGRFYQSRDFQTECLYCLGFNPEPIDDLLFYRENKNLAMLRMEKV